MKTILDLFKRKKENTPAKKAERKESTSLLDPSNTLNYVNPASPLSWPSYDSGGGSSSDSGCGGSSFDSGGGSFDSGCGGGGFGD